MTDDISITLENTIRKTDMVRGVRYTQARYQLRLVAFSAGPWSLPVPSFGTCVFFKSGPQQLDVVYTRHETFPGAVMEARIMNKVSWGRS